MQQYAGIYLLQNHSIFFGFLPHSSSGVHKTVIVASGAGHNIWATNFLQRKNRKIVFDVQVAVHRNKLTFR